jgi:hypothetical protein
MTEINDLKHSLRMQADAFILESHTAELNGCYPSFDQPITAENVEGLIIGESNFIYPVLFTTRECALDFVDQLIVTAIGNFRKMYPDLKDITVSRDTSFVYLKIFDTIVGTFKIKEMYWDIYPPIVLPVEGQQWIDVDTGLTHEYRDGKWVELAKE